MTYAMALYFLIVICHICYKLPYMCNPKNNSALYDQNYNYRINIKTVETYKFLTHRFVNSVFSAQYNNILFWNVAVQKNNISRVLVITCSLILSVGFVFIL